MKVLDGRELAGFVKERQAKVVREMERAPELTIIRDSDNPVITKYVELKRRYGEDIGVLVRDVRADNGDGVIEAIREANRDVAVSGMIVQLPLSDSEKTDETLAEIAPEKDVDGLSGRGKFDSATATAINWLLAGHNIELNGAKIALVGRGRLVGAPLYKMWTDSGFDVTMLHRGDDLSQLRDFDIIVTATGVPGLITNEMVRPGAVVVDAGTASEDRVLVGDVAEEVRKRTDLKAITPKIGGVGPLTVGVLFENVIAASVKTD